MKLKKLKLKSKKGVTLVELIIGITIIVIIFAATLGAMVTGYTTTVYNADENRAAAINASVNEAISEYLISYGIGDVPNSTELADIIASADALADDIYGDNAEYVDWADFPKSGYDCQYTLKFDDTSPSSTADDGVSDVEIYGVTIRTAINNSNGILIYESFVPYS